MIKKIYKILLNKFFGIGYDVGYAEGWESGALNILGDLKNEGKINKHDYTEYIKKYYL